MDQKLYRKYEFPSSRQRIIIRNMFSSNRPAKSVDFRSESRCGNQSGQKMTQQSLIEHLQKLETSQLTQRFKKLEEQYLGTQEAYVQMMKEKRLKEVIEDQKKVKEEQELKNLMETRLAVESSRKREFYEQQSLFRDFQAQKKQKEFLLYRIDQEDSLKTAKMLAKEEEREKLEEYLFHRKKCRLQFEMLEEQRKNNLLLR